MTSSARIWMRKLFWGMGGFAAVLILMSKLAPAVVAQTEFRTRLMLETMTQSVGLTGLLISWGVIAALFAAVVALSFGRGGVTDQVDRAKRDAETQAAGRRQAEEQLLAARQTIAALGKEMEGLGKEIESLGERVETSAALDGLTGLPNHRSFHLKLTEECWRASRYEAPLSIIVLDIDHFRDYNETFGVGAGDDVLKTTSALLRRAARACDFVTRYGGEQFAIILPEATPAQAEAAAERFREIIAGGRWQKRGIAVSAGVASMSLGQSSALLAAQADRAVSLAKTRGRNCVATDWEQPERMAA